LSKKSVLRLKHLF